ncbi:hypothetical protein NE586_10005 [Gemmiger formicilis]|uniref:hypothetical protein n=1 Tax=Gemmiger formicilis TaxID=745368 RepID=UPI002109B979|nr:hypothetical protein [Gemmiger formicilis]MCQ5080224.1 hypothetical protein [Gemmiger formicilis]MCQ5116948.1 hypothetical protein [Gemmiger formicilis]
MKKKLCAIFITILAFMLFAPAAFAADARWRNVATITPAISARDGSYASVVSCLEGTTKIECTLVLYEKNWLGAYSEISRCSSTYYGQKGKFSGTANIKSGTTYKLETIATVTRNGSSETVNTTFEKKC